MKMFYLKTVYTRFTPYFNVINLRNYIGFVCTLVHINRLPGPISYFGIHIAWCTLRSLFNCARSNVEKVYIISLAKDARIYCTKLRIPCHIS